MAGGRRGGGRATPAAWAKRAGAALYLAGDGRVPGFGYFPNARRPTTFAHLEPPPPPYDYAVELRHRGHAVLAFEYHGAGVAHMVQVWTPPVPAITFDTSVNRMLRSLRSTGGPYREPGTVATGHPEFDARFTVYCEHEDFARGVLTAPLLHWLLTDPRTPGHFALTQSVALTSASRRLSLDDVLPRAEFLIDLARGLPSYVWRYRR